MRFRTQSEALKKISVTTRNTRGIAYTQYSAYLGTNPITGKETRIYASSEEELKQRIIAFYDNFNKAGGLNTILSQRDIMDARIALELLKDHGISMSLADCAKEICKRMEANAVKPMDIVRAYEEYMEHKPEGADKKKSLRTIGRWVMSLGEGVNVVDISTRDIAEYLTTNFGQNKPRTYNSHLTYIRTFLNWCLSPERKYVSENASLSIKKKVVEWEEPTYVSVENTERIFRILESVKDEHPDYLLYATLSFFCGTRHDEIVRIGECDDAATILLDDETVRIAKGKGFQKGRAPRAFHIHPTAMQWFKSIDFESALEKLSHTTPRNLIYFVRQNNIPWVVNGGRHTFITMHVAAYGDPAKTQAIVATSAKMRADHYCGLTSRKEGEAYFNILPSV